MAALRGRNIPAEPNQSTAPSAVECGRTTDIIFQMTPDSSPYGPDGSIVLRSHDPAWSTAFDAAAAELTAPLSGVIVVLHHVGSTAIPGIAAKPVIDILAVVTELDALDQRTEALVAAGYEALGEYGIPQRRYFRRDSSSGARTHQVHAFPRGHDQIERMLLFRDYLRAAPAVAKQYEVLKHQLAAQHAGNSEAYASAKTDFVEMVLSRARAGASELRAPGQAP